MKIILRTLLHTIIFGICCIFASQAYADKAFLAKYTQTLFNADNELGINGVNVIKQSRSGYIWIGGYGGLIRYDGNEFVVFNEKTSSTFAASNVMSLYEDVFDILWIGTNDDGLFKRENNVFSRIADTSGGAFVSIRAITGNSYGDIYVGSSNGIGRVTKNGIERIRAGEINNASILSLTCDRENNVWGVTRDGLVFMLTCDDNLKIYRLAEEARSITTCRDGRVVVGTLKGGIIVATRKGDSSEHNIEYYVSSPINTINSVFEDHKGIIWVCGDNGIGYFDKNYVFNLMGGCLLTTSVQTMIEDYEQNFWFASSRQGVVYVKNHKFMDVNFASSLERMVVNSTQKYKGLLYVGTDNGLYAIDVNDWNVISNELTKFIDGKRVRSLMVDSLDRLWVGVYQAKGVVCMYPDGRIVSYTADSGLPDNKVRNTMELKDGSIAVASNSGFAIISNEKVVSTLTRQDGLINPVILSMSQSDDGTIYLGSDGGGIFAVKDGVVSSPYTMQNGLPSGIILRMLYDKDNGGLWISTGTQLCFRRDSDGIIQKVNVNAAIESGIFDLKKENENLLLFADTGIHIVDAKGLLSNPKQKVVSYTKKDGLRAPTTANSWNDIDDDGNVYLCCVNGVYSMNLITVPVNYMTPKIAINKVDVDGVVYENPTSLQLSSNAQRLTFDIAILSFANPKYNTGSFILQGADNSRYTVQSKNLNNISYTNLRGGNYTMVFSATNSDGISSSESLILEIKKDKAIIEEPLFALFVSILLLWIVFEVSRAYHKRRENELLKRQKELNEITSQAITAIANTIDAKDIYTKGHSHRVAEYSVLIAQKLGYGPTKTENLYYTALLHDIGKIGVPDNILNKKGKLTNVEYEIMKQHSMIGGEILESITTIKEISDGAAYHHERYDGKGYNRGLKGEEIPFIARIICVADSVDAMASSRPYKDSLSKSYVVSELKRCSGVQFDPRVAEIMIQLIEEGKILMLESDSAGAQGIAL